MSELGAVGPMMRGDSVTSDTMDSVDSARAAPPREKRASVAGGRNADEPTRGPRRVSMQQQQQQQGGDFGAMAATDAVARQPVGQSRRRSSLPVSDAAPLLQQQRPAEQEGALPIEERGGGEPRPTPAASQKGLKSSLKGQPGTRPLPQRATSVPPSGGSGSGPVKQVVVRRNSAAALGPEAGESAQYGSAMYGAAKSVGAKPGPTFVLAEREPRDRGAGGSVASRSTTGRKTIGRLRRALAEQVWDCASFANECGHLMRPFSDRLPSSAAFRARSAGCGGPSSDF